MSATLQPASPSIGEVHRVLDQKLVRGIAWTGIAKWSSQLVSWGSTLVIARLLLPADYGLVGMSTLFIGLVNLLSEFGIGATVVARKDLSGRQIAQLNTVALGVGTLCVAASCLAAPMIARFFAAPQLKAVVVVMSIGFILSAIQTVPYSLLQRNLRFKLLAGIEGARALTTTGCSVLLAIGGFGFWTLVWGNLAGAAAGALLTISVCRHRFCLPDRNCVSALSFGGHILVGTLAWYVFSNADFLTAGKLLGEGPLGAYVLAWYVASTPVEKITGMMSRVGPAFFSAVQEQISSLRRYLLGLTEALALVTFPASIGLAAVAKDLVAVAFGPKWQATVAPLQLLAIVTAIRSITPLLPYVLNVRQDSKYPMWNSIVCAIVLPAGFLVGSRWGVAGIALVWVSVYPILMVPLFRRVFQSVGISNHDYWKVLWPAISSCLFMACTVVGLQWLLGQRVPTAIRLVLEITLGAAAYISLMLLGHGDRTRAALRALRSSIVSNG